MSEVLLLLEGLKKNKVKKGEDERKKK